MAADFHPAASREFWKAIDRYEDEAPGIGVEFLTAVEEATALLELHPEAGEQIAYARRKVRRWPLGRFPYVIFYTVEPAIFIVAVAHAKQRPGYWLERL